MTFKPCNPNTLGLLAPTLPQATRHGVGRSAAMNLTVRVPPYPDMDPGDLIELFWDHHYVAPAVVDAHDLDDGVWLRVPHSFLRTGKARTWYRVSKVGYPPADSPVVKLWVKLDVPGGERLVAGDDENQGLPPLHIPRRIRRGGLGIEQLQAGLDLTIEAYPNMDAYDEITVRWGDVRMDLPAISAEAVGKPIRLRVPSALIVEAGLGRTQDVTYCVIDRVGNNSRWAPPRRIQVPDVELAQA